MERKTRTPRNPRNSKTKESLTVALDDGEGKLLNAKTLGVKDSNIVEMALGDLLEKTRQWNAGRFHGRFFRPRAYSSPVRRAVSCAVGKFRRRR